MAGTWLTQNKVRPGAYINFKAAHKSSLQPGERGIVALPMRLSWGPLGIIQITADDIIRGNSLSLVGLRSTDDALVPLTCALENAPEALVYRMGTGGRNAYGSMNSAVGVQAIYPGALGNSIIVSVVQRSSTKYDIITTLRGLEVDRQTVTSVQEFVPNDWIEFFINADAYEFTPLATLPDGISDISVAQLQAEGDVLVSCNSISNGYELRVTCDTEEIIQSFLGAAWDGVVTFNSNGVAFNFDSSSMYGVFTPSALPDGLSNLAVEKATTGGYVEVTASGNSAAGYTIKTTIAADEYSETYTATEWEGQTVHFEGGPVSFDLETKYTAPAFVPDPSLPAGVSNVDTVGFTTEGEVTLSRAVSGSDDVFTLKNGSDAQSYTATGGASSYDAVTFTTDEGSSVTYDRSVLKPVWTLTDQVLYTDVTVPDAFKIDDNIGGVNISIGKTTSGADVTAYTFTATYGDGTKTETYNVAQADWFKSGISPTWTDIPTFTYDASEYKFTYTLPTSMPSGFSDLTIDTLFDSAYLASGPLYVSGTYSGTTATLQLQADTEGTQILGSQSWESADWDGQTVAFTVTDAAGHTIGMSVDASTVMPNSGDTYAYAELFTANCTLRDSLAADVTLGSLSASPNVAEIEAGVVVGSIDTDTSTRYANGLIVGSIDVSMMAAWNSGQVVGTNAATGDITPVAGVQLQSGADPAYSEVNDYNSFMNALRDQTWQCMAAPTTNGDVPPNVLSFIKGLREDDGKKVQAVVYNYPAADYEGIISMSQGYKIGDEEYDVTDAICWFAGATAGAQLNDSNTYKIITGATGILDAYEPDDIEDRLNGGELVLSTRQDGTVIVEKDINTLHNFTEDRTYNFSKNRVIRTLDDIATQITITFENSYIGKVDNNDAGRTLFKGDVIGYINELALMGAVQNFDSENDIEVLPGNDIDSVVCNLWLQPVDSMEKLYMTVTVS